MKNNLFIVLFLFFCSCQNKKQSVHYRFDEQEYVLVTSKKDSSGNDYFKVYRNRKDTTKYLAKSYWKNGILQSSLFFTNGVRNGPHKIYNNDGTLSFESFYYLNKKTGLEINYEYGKISDFAIYDNGVQLEIDSSVKKEILK